MRLMSFALTKPQILARTKKVTRRAGWAFLKVGMLFQPVEKCMGLRPGEKVQLLGAPLRCAVLRWEPLRLMTDDLAYGREECVLEGFPEMNPAEFIDMFCASHAGCTPETQVHRIAFDYT